MPSARELIDANRRKNQILKIIFPILIFCTPFVYLVMIEDKTESPMYGVIYFPLFAWMIYSSLRRILYKDRCPNSLSDISMLPNERRFFWQRLSKKIKMCPFCKLDFSAYPASSNAQDTSEDERQSYTTPLARDVINVNRQKKAQSLLWVYLWMIGTVICFIFAMQQEINALYFLSIGSLFIVFAWYGLTHEDDCPSCGEDISNLPSNRSFVFPKLSKTVKVCPYCGEVFSESPKSPEPNGLKVE